MRSTILAVGSAALLLTGAMSVQEAHAQRAGMHHGGHYYGGGGGYYRSGYYGGSGWGWGGGALLGATAALATAPLWAGGYGYATPAYSYGYPSYYDGGYYDGYAAPVVYTTRVRPRRVVYAGPRRAIRARYVQPRYVTYAPRAHRVMVRQGVRPGVHRAAFRY